MPSVLCPEGAVRLVDGDIEQEGRVEVCFSGVWGSISLIKAYFVTQHPVVGKPLELHYYSNQLQSLIPTNSLDISQLFPQHL